MDLGSVAPARMTLSTRHDVLVLKDYVSETVTATYRPPEFFEPLVDMRIDERTDIWSLGCTMFAMHMVILHIMVLILLHLVK